MLEQLPVDPGARANIDLAPMCRYPLPKHHPHFLSQQQLHDSYYQGYVMLPGAKLPASQCQNYGQHALTTLFTDDTSTHALEIDQISMLLDSYSPPIHHPSAFWRSAEDDPLLGFQCCKRQAKKKAVLVGINYFKLCGQLRGCVNDTRNMASYLSGHFGFSQHDMVILTDDQYNPKSLPTKENILLAMHWLVKDAQPNDVLFFFYSGHGGPELYLDGDDSYDEIIYPIDFRENGHIEQAEIYRIMIWPLPDGVQLTTVFDSRWKHDFSARHY